MPNWGKVVEWSDLEYTLTGSATASGSGGTLTYGYTGSCFTSYAFNTVLVYTGVSLQVESSFDGTSGSWSVRYDGPGAPFGGYVIGGSTYSSVSISARIKNLKIYHQLLGALYNVSWDSVEVYVNGSLSIVLPGSSVNETSNGVGPCYIPLIGVPLQVASSVTGGIDQPPWTYDECDPSNVPDIAEFEAEGSIQAGMRFKETAGGDWHSLPIYLDIRSVPCGGCPYSLTTTGLISGTSTHLVTLSPFLKSTTKKEYDSRLFGNIVVRVRCVDFEGNELLFNDYFSGMGDYTLACDGTPVIGAVDDLYKNTSTSESGNGAICVIPNLEKIIHRLGHDTAALIYRNDLPLVTGSASRGWTIDAVSESVSANPAIFPGSLPFVGALGNDLHPMEDFLGFPTPCPLSVTKSKSESVGYERYMVSIVDMGTHPPPDFSDPAQCPEGTARIGVSVYDTLPETPEGSGKSETVSWTSIDTVDFVSNYQQHASALLRYIGTWGNILWHYLHFRANYSDVDFDSHWGPGRQQHKSNPALPAPERTNTRADVIGSSWFDSGHVPFMDALMGGQLWLGTSRHRLYTPTIPAECQTGASSVWNFGVYDPDLESWDGGGSVGSGSVTIGTDTTKTTLDVLSFSAFPFMYPLICDRIQIPASGFSNVASFSVKLIGIDGSEVELCTASGTHVIPKGPNSKYAGSWGIQNSPGGGLDDLGVDADANGISSLVMADPLHCSAFSLLPARSYYRLRYDIVKTNPAHDATVPHPVFKRNTTTPKMICESGHIQTLIWPNGSALRLGNWDFYIQGVGFQNPPVIKAFEKTTIIDALCTIRLIFEARAADDGLTTELASMFDTLEGQSVGVVDKFSVAYLNPLAGKWLVASSFQWSLINTMAEGPPLACFPNKSFGIGSTDWSQTGPYKHEVLEWSQEDRYLIHPTNPMHQLNAAGSAQITTSVAGIPGWAITQHREPVDNLETPTWDIQVLGTKYADATPWRGFFGICDIEVDGIAVWAHNLLSVFGFVHWVWASGSGVAHRRSNTSWPLERDVDVMVSGDSSDACPVLRQNADGRLFCVFVRGVKGSRHLLECFSDNDGRTWTTPAVIGMAEYCYTFTDGFGYEGRAKFVFDTGDSGPGSISVQTRGPGETAFGSWVTVAVGGSPVLFAEGSFGIVAAEDSAGHWILTAVNDGGSEPTNYASTDGAKTWKLA